MEQIRVWVMADDGGYHERYFPKTPKIPPRAALQALIEKIQREGFRVLDSGWEITA